MKPSKLAKKLDITPMHVGRLRKQLFPNAPKGDLTDEQAQAIREFIDETESQESRKEMEEALQPVIKNAIVEIAKDNNRRVQAKLLPDMTKIMVLMPMGCDPRRFLRKPIKVEEVEYQDEKYYRHASLAGRVWKSLR